MNRPGHYAGPERQSSPGPDIIHAGAGRVRRRFRIFGCGVIDGDALGRIACLVHYKTDRAIAFVHARESPTWELEMGLGIAIVVADISAMPRKRVLELQPH